MKVTLTRVTQNPIDAIEEAASNCYNSQPTGGKIMRSCYDSGHHSVLEFAQFTFHIEGVSRALLAQLTRHRVAGFAVRSQRYCDEDGFSYVIPPSIKNNSNALESYKGAMLYLQLTYKRLQDFGIPNEDARMVLPNACETILEFTVNGRELIHICNERLCRRAQWEIRQLFQEIKRVVAEYDEQCAEFAKFLVPKCEKFKDTPFCTEHKSCGRHKTLKEIYYQSIPKALDELIDEAKSGLITDTELAKKFWNTFCEE